MPPAPTHQASEPTQPVQAEAGPNHPEADRQPEAVPVALAAAVRVEQRRIAQALHDTVSQTLTGTYFQALVIARKLEGSASGAAGDVAKLVESIHQAVLELQEVARGLQPGVESNSD